MSPYNVVGDYQCFGVSIFVIIFILKMEAACSFETPSKLHSHNTEDHSDLFFLCLRFRCMSYKIFVTKIHIYINYLDLLFCHYVQVMVIGN